MIMQTDYIYLIVSDRQSLLVALFCGSVEGFRNLQKNFLGRR